MSDQSPHNDRKSPEFMGEPVLIFSEPNFGELPRSEHPNSSFLTSPGSHDHYPLDSPAAAAGAGRADGPCESQTTGDGAGHPTQDGSTRRRARATSDAEDASRKSKKVRHASRAPSEQIAAPNEQSVDETAKHPRKKKPKRKLPKGTPREASDSGAPSPSHNNLSLNVVHAKVAGQSSNPAPEQDQPAPSGAPGSTTSSPPETPVAHASGGSDAPSPSDDHPSGEDVHAKEVRQSLFNPAPKQDQPVPNGDPGSTTNRLTLESEHMETPISQALSNSAPADDRPAPSGPFQATTGSLPLATKLVETPLARASGVSVAPSPSGANPSLNDEPSKVAKPAPDPSVPSQPSELTTSSPTWDLDLWEIPELDAALLSIGQAQVAEQPRGLVMQPNHRFISTMQRAQDSIALLSGIAPTANAPVLAAASLAGIAPTANGPVLSFAGIPPTANAPVLAAASLAAAINKSFQGSHVGAILHSQSDGPGSPARTNDLVQDHGTDRPAPDPSQPDGPGSPARTNDFVQDHGTDRPAPDPSQPNGPDSPARTNDLVQDHGTDRPAPDPSQPDGPGSPARTNDLVQDHGTDRPAPDPSQPDGPGSPARTNDFVQDHGTDRPAPDPSQPNGPDSPARTNDFIQDHGTDRPAPDPSQPDGPDSPARTNDFVQDHGTDRPAPDSSPSGYAPAASPSKNGRRRRSGRTTDPPGKYAGADPDSSGLSDDYTPDHGEGRPKKKKKKFSDFFDPRADLSESQDVSPSTSVPNAAWPSSPTASKKHRRPGPLTSDELAAVEAKQAEVDAWCASMAAVSRKSPALFLKALTLPVAKRFRGPNPWTAYERWYRVHRGIHTDEDPDRFMARMRADYRALFEGIDEDDTLARAEIVKPFIEWERECIEEYLADAEQNGNLRKELQSALREINAMGRRLYMLYGFHMFGSLIHLGNAGSYSFGNSPEWEFFKKRYEQDFGATLQTYQALLTLSRDQLANGGDAFGDLIPPPSAVSKAESSDKPDTNSQIGNKSKQGKKGKKDKTDKKGKNPDYRDGRNNLFQDHMLTSLVGINSKAKQVSWKGLSDLLFKWKCRLVNFNPHVNLHCSKKYHRTGFCLKGDHNGDFIKDMVDALEPGANTEGAHPKKFWMEKWREEEMKLPVAQQGAIPLILGWVPSQNPPANKHVIQHVSPHRPSDSIAQVVLCRVASTAAWYRAFGPKDQKERKPKSKKRSKTKPRGDGDASGPEEDEDSSSDDDYDDFEDDLIARAVAAAAASGSIDPKMRTAPSKERVDTSKPAAQSREVSSEQLLAGTRGDPGDNGGNRTDNVDVDMHVSEERPPSHVDEPAHPPPPTVVKPKPKPRPVGSKKKKEVVPADSPNVTAPLEPPSRGTGVLHQDHAPQGAGNVECSEDSHPRYSSHEYERPPSPAPSNKKPKRRPKPIEVDDDEHGGVSAPPPHRHDRYRSLSKDPERRSNRNDGPAEEGFPMAPPRWSGSIPPSSRARERLRQQQLSERRPHALMPRDYDYDIGRLQRRRSRSPDFDRWRQMSPSVDWDAPGYAELPPRHAYDSYYDELKASLSRLRHVR
ncbi:hypothetical protein PUNSTDRAFT_138230 [Punctularia strigosozonata HHB-11173 SS5]|uniref:Uncharacterized protein n=1 Tax=Punctularia strigosozonata (strain HHB-11173) TaxID=741275 RepID=R7S3T1_PUNST|nr:uncharacterized protein PUNSTDRAFT_138230 [Punctularia strigosozonata HHB-11173 SS5]EIN05050.1 hypothetical protein PUNSTDRAFT_138230 [Punctularia strigosozonata HHB-11173 SS5]